MFSIHKGKKSAKKFVEYVKKNPHLTKEAIAIMMQIAVSSPTIRDKVFIFIEETKLINKEETNE